MNKLPWFKNWFNSTYYHKLYGNRNEQEAALFIDTLITHLTPQPNATMADVACGKGRHSIHLAKKGYDVTGIDLSEESINEALLSQTDNLHFYQHDMRLPFWINYFDYAFNFFTSFGYFDSQRENDNAIRSIAQSIKPNGYFIFDYLNVSFTINHFTTNIIKEIDGVKYTIDKWQDNDFFYKKIIIEDALLPTPLVHIEKVAKFSLPHFTAMFAKQGLQVKEVLGDYQLNTYDELQSPRLIIIACKQ